MAAIEHQANRCAQGLRPTRRVSERGAGPIVSAHEARHLAFAREEVEGGSSGDFFVRVGGLAQCLTLTIVLPG